MWRVSICLCAALLAGTSSFSHAQIAEHSDRQNPREYTDEDSQSLRVAADLLYPVGFAAEWLIMRPLHYVTTDTPISPVFTPADSQEWQLPPPIPIIPDNTLATGSEAEPPPQEMIINPHAPLEPSAEIPSKPVRQPAAPTGIAKPPESSGQPTLH